MMMKRKCVLGVLKTEEGLRIKEEMLCWLRDKYDVITVEQNAPGKLLEYPALKLAVETAIEFNEPILYIHTKGAANVNQAQFFVRELWKREFNRHAEEYFQFDAKPQCKAPIVSSSTNVCWFNAFTMNVAAAKEIQKTFGFTENRWHYESAIIPMKVEVIGRLADIDNLNIQFNKFYEAFDKSTKYITGFQPILSLTSWKKRIDTVHKTIENIINVSNPHKIVLTLSTSEFPNKENDLPRSVMDLTKDKLEILWIEENENKYKSFKKILFTMQKYPNHPIVSADDDCLYNEDYVGKLYEAWKKLPWAICSYNADVATKPYRFGCGAACLYPPNCFGNLALDMLNDDILKTCHDDIFYGVLAMHLRIPIIDIYGDNSKYKPFEFHDEIEGLYNTGKEVNGSIAIRVCEYEYNKFIL